MKARVANGELTETAELKAIRESLLRARMGEIVQLPGEAAFCYKRSSVSQSNEGNLGDRAGQNRSRGACHFILLAQAHIRKWSVAQRFREASGLSPYKFTPATMPFRLYRRLRGQMPIRGQSIKLGSLRGSLSR